VADLDAGWPHGSQDAIGQAGEFLVWANLITQSGGGLHVFLPMLDRGIDAVVHRLEDGAFIAVQVKTKSVLHNVEFPIAVYENHLFTDDQLVIGVRLDGDRLGPFALVADSSTFKKKAARIEDRGRMLLVADVPTHPIPGHKWTEDLVALDHLAERLAALPSAQRAAPQGEAVSDEDRVFGFWGEEEVCRRLAMLEDCGLFRPFPDNETAEILVRRLATGATLGIQVKTGRLADPHERISVLVNQSNFIGEPTTLVVVLAWMLPEQRFHETCLVIPTDLLPSVAASVGGNFELHFRPGGSRESSRLDRYRIQLESLTETLAQHL
jgi:hypothetical protein